jgi:hypothetical protein
MKVCTRCREAKSPDDFNRSTRNRDGLHAYCRSCQRDHYRENSERHGKNVRRSARARIARLREMVVVRLRAGCVDCGNQDIRVLEFDHVRGVKVDSISEIIRRGLSVRTLEDELAKCEVRCRNCHQLVTLGRLGGSWHDGYLDP